MPKKITPKKRTIALFALKLLGPAWVKATVARKHTMRRRALRKILKAL